MLTVIFTLISTMMLMLMFMLHQLLQFFFPRGTESRDAFGRRAVQFWSSESKQKKTKRGRVSTTGVSAPNQLNVRLWLS